MNANRPLIIQYYLWPTSYYTGLISVTVNLCVR